MTNEKMLESLIAIGIGTGGFDYVKYNNLVEQLKADIRDENNKKSGKSNLAKLGKAILKNAVDNTGGKSFNTKHAMRFAHIQDGVQYILDGHRIAWFYDAIDLPMWNDEDGDWYHIERMLELEVDTEPLILPTIGDIKAELKANKGKAVAYTFEDGITVNARYLLDYMEGFSDIKVYANAEHSTKLPVWIESDLGGGLLLTINPGDNGLEPGFHVR